MKNKIATRLVLYFGVALLLFSIIVGSVFAWSFQQHSADLQRKELETRATRIADTLAGYLSEDQTMQRRNARHGMMHSRMAGFGNYLRFLDDIAMADVWLVDRGSNLVTYGRNYTMTYKELPVDAESIIQEVYSGSVAFSECFTPLLGEPSLTVGAPITDTSGTVLGAVLLHSAIRGLDEARKQQANIVAISILIALVITVPIAVLLSLRFTKPLGRMKQTAMQLASGDYQVKNCITQKDEIGELADSMDILADRLEQAKQEQERMENMRRTFFSNISHELRTPVTVMRGSLEALYEGVVNDPEQVQAYYKQMLQESIYLQRMVNDLLELARLQDIDFQIEKANINLCDIVEDAVRSMRRIANTKQVVIETEGFDTGRFLYGDYGRLRQMLLIVLDNAVKFSPNGKSVKLLLEELKDDTFVLSITDSGSGIPPQDLPHIFERFYRERGEENKQGTGLGLAIAKAIADRHDISIQVESQQGYTRFLFLFKTSPISDEE